MQDSRFIESEHRGINMARSIKGTALDPMNRRKERIKDKWMHVYDRENRILDYNHSQILHSNKEGFSPDGKKKLTFFFLSYPVSFRKVLSYILIKQFLSDKYVVIKNIDIARFSGIKEKDLDSVLYFLWKTLQLIRTNHDTYRVPGYIWNSDILDEVKKLQKDPKWKPKPILNSRLKRIKRKKARKLKAAQAISGIV